MADYSREYVCGFLFDEFGGKVALIEKKRPEWQAGKRNGIGGRIEKGETPIQAMVREFGEEAGMVVNHWCKFCEVYDPDDKDLVHFFVAFGPVDKVRTMTDEEVVVVGVRDLGHTVPNLRWLIPMAAGINEVGAADFYVIEERMAAKKDPTDAS
jgi:8-oxo-dGTP diphosphatase